MEKLRRNIQLEHQIDAFIRGGLSKMDVRGFIDELLDHPAYIEILQTEIILNYIITHQLVDTEFAYPIQPDTVKEQSCFEI